MTPQQEEKRARHLIQTAGAVGLALVVVVSGLLIADYEGKFQSVEHVTVEADRAGLLLDKGARVRLSGVPVGEVQGVKLIGQGKVAVDVALEKGMVSKIPADVTSSIRATTVFGSKYVDLEVPQGDSTSTPIAAGAVLRTNAVTVEVNDVFQDAMTDLNAIQPTKLNTTLTSAATALTGRGQELGTFFTDWNTYLKALDPHLGAFTHDLTLSASVVKSYGDAAPALIDAANNFGITSQTLVAMQPQLDKVLRSVAVAASTAGSLISALEAPLMAFNNEWLPVGGLLRAYSPEFGCTIEALQTHVDLFHRVFGINGDTFVNAKVSFLPGQDSYTFAKNAPRLATGVGPKCYQLSTPGHQVILPHYDFPDGSAGIYSNANVGKPVSLAQQPVSVYAGVVKDFLGQSGLTALLGSVYQGSSK